MGGGGGGGSCQGWRGNGGVGLGGGGGGFKVDVTEELNWGGGGSCQGWRVGGVEWGVISGGGLGQGGCDRRIEVIVKILGGGGGGGGGGGFGWIRVDVKEEYFVKIRKKNLGEWVVVCR